MPLSHNTTPLPDESMLRFLEGIRQLHSSNIAFWLGSAISYFAPSKCASVNQIKYEYILKPLQQLLQQCGTGGGDASIREASKLIEMMLTKEDSQLFEEVDHLPFEQFMNCLDKSFPEIPLKILNHACQERSHRPPAVRPNANHLWFVETALRLLETEHCDQITIFTTNYDTFLEEAFQDLCPSITLQETGKAYPVRRAVLEKGTLRIVKPHGCLKTKATQTNLVYNSRHWTNLIRNKEWLRQLEEPEAILWAGYSFSDPHLREIFAEWLRDDRPRLVLDREEKANSTPSGAQYLRQEFRNRFLADRITYCDLKEIEDHPLQYIANFFGYTLSQVPTNFVDVNDNVAHRFESIFGEFEKAAIISFLSDLVDACALGDACEMLNQYLHQCPPNASDFISRYLLQLGHRGDYSTAASECKVLRGRFDTPEAALVTCGYESFSRTVTSLDLENALLAFKALDEGQEVLSRPPHHPTAEWARAASFYTHRYLHFQVKTLLFEKLAPDPALLKLAREDPILNKVLSSIESPEDLERQLMEAASKEIEGHNIYGFAQLEDLRSQVLTTAAASNSDLADHYAEEAIQAAFHVRDIYFSLGQLNSVVLADRTLGWAWLAKDSCDVSKSHVGERRAIEAFTWGFLRSLRCSDSSLQWRLGANLIRLLWKEDLDYTSESQSREFLEQECRVLLKSLAAGESPSDLVDQSRPIICYIYSLYSKTKPRKRLHRMIGNKEGEMFPIFLPPDPNMG